MMVSAIPLLLAATLDWQTTVAVPMPGYATPASTVVPFADGKTFFFFGVAVPDAAPPLPGLSFLDETGHVLWQQWSLDDLNFTDVQIAGAHDGHGFDKQLYLLTTDDSSQPAKSTLLVVDGMGGKSRKVLDLPCPGRAAVYDDEAKVAYTLLQCGDAPHLDAVKVDGTPTVLWHVALPSYGKERHLVLDRDGHVAVAQCRAQDSHIMVSRYDDKGASVGSDLALMTMVGSCQEPFAIQFGKDGGIAVAMPRAVYTYAVDGGFGWWLVGDRYTPETLDATDAGGYAVLGERGYYTFLPDGAGTRQIPLSQLLGDKAHVKSTKLVGDSLYVSFVPDASWGLQDEVQIQLAKLKL